MYNSADILYFEKYLFNDTGEEARHFGLAILPSNLTNFKASILCAVMTSQPVRNPYAVHTLTKEDYTSLTRDTSIRLGSLDYVPLNGLDSTCIQPVDSLSQSDAKKCYKILCGVLFGKKPPISSNDMFLRAVIIREWKKKL